MCFHHVWCSLGIIRHPVPYRWWIEMVQGLSKPQYYNLRFVVPCIFNHSNKTPN